MVYEKRIMHRVFGLHGERSKRKKEKNKNWSTF